MIQTACCVVQKELHRTYAITKSIYKNMCELYCIAVPFLFLSQATFWDKNEIHRFCCVLMVSTVSHFSEIQESLIWTLCKIWLVLDKYRPQVNNYRNTRAEPTLIKQLYIQNCRIDKQISVALGNRRLYWGFRKFNWVLCQSITISDLYEAETELEQVAQCGRSCNKKYVFYIYIYIYICVCVCVCTSTLRWMWKWPCSISNGCSEICLEGLKKTTKTLGRTANSELSCELIWTYDTKYDM